MPKTILITGATDGYVADLSCMDAVAALAKGVAANHTTLDVLVNNAGVYGAPDSVTQAGLDIRFAVNAIAPYLLTQQLMPLMDGSGRVVNVSAAQAPVDLGALAGRVKLSDDFAAYAQSKLALALQDHGPAI